MLVEQDIRERKGAFYTPLKWVELSQQYMANYFGEDYQDDYYIWDCAAGTGNLLNGLTNKYKIFASTIDQADVDALKERSSSAKTLLEENVFQFDFLNDSFESVFGNFSFYSYKKACGQKKTVRGSKNSRRLSNGTPAI